MNLFVYGTLMSGMGANHFLRGQTKIADATINGKLYDLGLFPGLKDSEEGVVHGELWEISPDLLRTLDGYEGYEEGYIDSLYVRQLVTVHWQGAEVQAWTYYINRQVGAGQLIASGNWRKRGDRHAKVRHEESHGVEAG